jgi:hypothetical protein
VNKQQAGLDEYNFVHGIACCNHFKGILALLMPIAKTIIHMLFTIQNTVKTGQKTGKAHKNWHFCLHANHKIRKHCL